jgi:hypothetical protein
MSRDTTAAGTQKASNYRIKHVLASLALRHAEAQIDLQPPSAPPDASDTEAVIAETPPGARMAARLASAVFLVVLGLVSVRNAVVPVPSASELALRREPSATPLTIYEASHLICEVESIDVCESSGLVRSVRDPRWLWTHNDSGGAPAIVAFDRKGLIHGVVKIAGASNRDWEEMTSFRLGGVPWLVIADCGNNFYEARSIRLYFVREPNPDAKEVAYDAMVEFQFESGARNCEAMAFDDRERKLLFATKVSSGRCEVFELPLPNLHRDETGLIAKRIAAPNLSQATGMCISNDGQRAVVVNYECGYEFTRRRNESWQAAFARTPRRIQLDWRMPQREAVCFDEDGRSLLMTSEARQGFLNSLLGNNLNSKIPLWRVPGKSSHK